MIKTFFEKLDESAANQRPGAPSRNNHKISSNFMHIISKVQNLQKGHEAELERVAEQAIRENWGKILDHVDLHIKFAGSDEIQKMVKESFEKSSKSSLEILVEDGIISQFQERKINQNMLAGVSKTVRRIVNNPGILEKLENIFGNRSEAAEYQNLLIQIANTASSLGWKIPAGIQLKMWESDQIGFSGSNQITWETPVNQNSAENLAQEILREFEESDEITQKVGKLFKESSPTIKATGTDLVFLIKETLNGIHAVISASAVPEESEIFETEDSHDFEDFEDVAS